MAHKIDDGEEAARGDRSELWGELDEEDEDVFDVEVIDENTVAVDEEDEDDPVVMVDPSNLEDRTVGRNLEDSDALEEELTLATLEELLDESVDDNDGEQPAESDGHNQELLDAGAWPEEPQIDAERDGYLYWDVLLKRGNARQVIFNIFT